MPKAVQHECIRVRIYTENPLAPKPRLFSLCLPKSTSSLFLSFPIVIWNPHYSSLLHSQKVIDFLTAKPNNPSTVPFSVPKQGPILLAVLLSRISPLGFWDTALCWSTFLSSSCPGTLPLWSSLSIILCSYISLTLSKLLLFIHTTGKLCFWASPRHSPTYNALILATSPRTEAYSPLKSFSDGSHAFPPAPKLSLANPAHVALITYFTVTIIIFLLLLNFL